MAAVLHFTILKYFLHKYAKTIFRAANSPDYRRSFPILRPILCVYEFLTKLPNLVNIRHFPGNEWH